MAIDGRSGKKLLSRICVAVSGRKGSSGVASAMLTILPKFASRGPVCRGADAHDLAVFNARAAAVNTLRARAARRQRARRIAIAQSNNLIIVGDPVLVALVDWVICLRLR
jgi:hypothetical protein